mmetsp:Transcript_2556/g.6925  ORF Transcript_2556/g.6925 Transcript_2556/m.6925 type:complete len:96 (+) Transcript_2556:3913-4200(+)
MISKKIHTVSTKTTLAKETRKIWSMYVTTLVGLDTKHSVFQKWIQISCASTKTITVDHVKDGMELTTTATSIGNRDEIRYRKIGKQDYLHLPLDE